MLHGVIETAHRVIVWAYSVIVGAHSIFLRAHFSMWRYIKSLCSMNKHYCDVHKEVSQSHFDVIQGQYEGHVEPFWWSNKIIVKVTPSQCEDTQTFWGDAKIMWRHSHCMAYICDVAYSHLRSNRNVLNVTICHCEYHTESLLRSYGIIMNVPQPLWGHRSYGEGIQNHSKSHPESLGWHIEILC